MTTFDEAFHTDVNPTELLNRLSTLKGRVETLRRESQALRNEITDALKMADELRAFAEENDILLHRSKRGRPLKVRGKPNKPVLEAVAAFTPKAGDDVIVDDDLAVPASLRRAP